MVAWLGTGILSKHTEHPCMMNVDNAPHAHKALQLPGYDVTSHPREQVENSGSPAPKGYPRLFCWRRVDDIVRDFSFLKFANWASEGALSNLVYLLLHHCILQFLDW